MLPTCPACKQSVLDDEATECPFCGANMKTGKGGKGAAAPSKPASPKPAAEPPKKEVPPKSDAASGKSGSKGKSILDDDDDDPFGDKDVDDDDPFAAAAREAEAHKAKAIPMTAKKTKTNQAEQKCPMCDTVGFVPENSGGKDVKCCNPSCKAPIFMVPKNLAPPVQISTAKPKPAKKEKSGPGIKPLYLAIGGGLLLVAIAAAVIWFWPEKGGKDTGRFEVDPDKPKYVPVEQPTNKTDKKPPKEGDTEQSQPKLDVAKLLVYMQDLGLSEKLANKKYCQQRTAIACAVAGDISGMEKQFKGIDELEKTLQHFKIPAYMTLGWDQLAKGDKAGASKTAGDAVAATVNIGSGSRDTQEAVIDLAAFLIANGKTAVAQTVLSSNLKADESTPLVVAMLLARHRRDFDIDQELPGHSVNPAYALPQVAVTLVLTTEGLWTEAQEWAGSQTDVEAKTDCLIAWADAKLRHSLAQKQSTDAAAEGAAAKLTPAGQVQLLARLALTEARAGNQAEAERLIAAAQTALKAIPVPAPAKLKTFKQALDWKAPEPTALRQAAVGASAVGLAQAQIKKIDEGWTTTLEALKFARAMAPSPSAIGALKNEASSVELDALRARVRKELELSTRDAAERKTRELQGKMDDIEKEAASRFNLQELILESAVAQGMGKLVWSEILGLTQNPDVNEREPYLTGTLPAHLLAQFQADGLATEAKEVSEQVDTSQLPEDPNFSLQQTVDAALKSNDFPKATAAFNLMRLTGGTEEVALRGLIRQAKQPGQALPTLVLAQKLDTRSGNQFVKYEAIRLLAAYAAKLEDPNKIHKTVIGPGTSSLDKISGLLGVMEGYFAKPKPAEKAPEEKAPADAAAKKAE